MQMEIPFGLDRVMPSLATRDDAFWAFAHYLSHFLETERHHQANRRDLAQADLRGKMVADFGILDGEGNGAVVEDGDHEGG